MQFFGTKKLAKVDDWIPVVSRKNWVEEHSAYELAHSWQSARGFPSRVAYVLTSGPGPVFAGLRPEYGVVEKPVFLDTLKGPSWTDVMVYCRNADSEAVVVAVEGKAKEPFGAVVSDWVRAKGEKGESDDPKPSRLKRLDYLAGQLGVALQPDSTLRYQLLHRTASAITESQLHAASAAVVLVHSFCREPDDNWDDYSNFARTVGVPDPVRDFVQGPVQLGTSRDTTVYFVWVSDKPVEPSN